MMKVLPVAALTASAIWVMSASLKFAVMCCACCAEASETASSAASAHIAYERKPVTGSTPRISAPERLLAVVAARHFGGWRWRLIGRLRDARGGARRRLDQAVRFLRDLGDIQRELLLLALTDDRDARLARAAEGAQNLLAAIAVIERRAIDRRHLIAGTQPQPREGGPVAPRVNPETVHAVMVHHR